MEIEKKVENTEIPDGKHPDKTEEKDYTEDSEIRISFGEPLMNYFIIRVIY